MKILVAYLSKTGNTKKVAEAIFGEIQDQKEIKAIADIDSLDGFDAAFLGFPIQRMGPDKKTARLLKKHCVKGRKIILFITHASPEDGPDLPPMLDKFRQLVREAHLVDMFDCQGELAKGIKRIMSILPSAQLRRWARQDDSQGQPDQVRLDRARVFAGRVMARLHDDGRGRPASAGTGGSGLLQGA